ncbi:MAG: hypothetical protein WHV66_00130 [Anaerolineales bacterium]
MTKRELDLCRIWAEMFCVDPKIWQELADEYRKLERYSMADYCQRHADHYAGKDTADETPTERSPHALPCT